MTRGFSGLPDHPVNEAATQALDQHSDLEFCHPVYHLADDPDSVIVIALAKDNRAHFLYFNPENQQWEQLVATDMPKAVTDDIPLDEQEIDERLMQHYEEEEIEPAGYPNNPVEGAIQGFPSEPLTERQIETIQQQHPMIGEVMPLVNTADGDRTIAMIFFFNDIIGEQRITVATGYEPEIGEWELIDSAVSSDPDLDQALEQLRDMYATWVANNYTMDEIQPIEDPETALKS